MKSDAHSASLPVGGQSRQEFLLRWLEEERPEALESLWGAAAQTRTEFRGKQVDLWATVKISSHCQDDCVFCGLRAGQKALPRYRLSAAEVLAAARSAATAGCRLLVLQSGRDEGLAADAVGELIRRIVGETGLAVALSLGQRTEAEVAAWRRAGAERYFLRFITANTLLYRFLHGGVCDDPRARLPLLAALKQLGYQVGSGILVGFPGQGPSCLADDLEFLRGLDLEAILAGPYIWPAELSATRMPVREGDVNSAQAVSRVVALARLLCPSADIPSTASLAAVGGAEIHAAALRRGANVLTIDFTPPARREEYRCYPGRAGLDEAAWQGGAGGLRAMVEQSRAVPAPSADGSPAGAALPELRIGVCMGSSCFCRGNNHTVTAVRDFLAAQRLGDRAVLEGHLCEGQCKHGPNVVIDGKMHHQADAATILECLRQRLKPRE